MEISGGDVSHNMLGFQSMNHVIFVYGTLLSGLRLHPCLKSAVLLGAGSVHAQLFDLGDYPGMICAPENEVSTVLGEVYAVSEDLLQKLDEVEEVVPHDDAASLYVRRRIALVHPASGLPAEVWCYLYNRSVQTCFRIPSGDYKAYLSAKASVGRG
jgi:gamma-glutamylcyclotransferase (GGCT)/AIG2-like uncharacterized protein YtfP